jgi:thiamine kinase-like enzyme
VLLHTDINPDNLLVRDDGEVTVVDWSWPTRGAAWTDLAFAVAAVRMYERFEELEPAPWRKAMTSAARAWADHREQERR